MAIFATKFIDGMSADNITPSIIKPAHSPGVVVLGVSAGGGGVVLMGAGCVGCGGGGGGSAAKLGLGGRGAGVVRCFVMR